MHTYGRWDDDLFNQVNDAAYEIGTFCAKWGRINVRQTKEKFGTVRVYCSLGVDCFYGLLFPRHCWVKPWWPYRLDLNISRWMMPPINRLVFPWQKLIYRLAYKRALRKYPHLRDEIMCCADFYDLLYGVDGYHFTHEMEDDSHV